MESYTGFAEVYDTFMDNIPYRQWEERIKEQLRRFGILPGNAAEDPVNDTAMDPVNDTAMDPANDEAEDPAQDALRQEHALICDLGCGTGTLTEMLSADGYEMIGIDLSEEMLEIAREKSAESGSDILYLCQDMREFELYGTVGACISVCDSINYLLEEREVLQTFRLVNNYLYPGGIFLFDVNTPYKYREVIGDATIAENREECSFIWDNYYHEEEEINEYELTFFVKEGQLYRKFSEVHYQRGYDLATIQTLLLEAGLKFVFAIDAESGDTVRETTERIFVCAQEYMKEQHE
ncbi:MAG: class I SAM-dependent methyltransferase [Lachnospiraceae bacterium]|nr:class I SAM-dependent methyltransferase [Lachnospiraceae bacterium]